MTRLLSTIFISCLLNNHASADIYSASNALSSGNYATAVAEFEKLAEAGDGRAQANLGYMYYAGEGISQDYEKAIYWYRKAATQGNKDAQYNLAVSYAFGEGIKQDLIEAAIWYRRAGKQGHIVSQYSLGISYAYGEGVPQDQKEAARWFKKAADQGYIRAQVHLGSMYYTGEGVEQNYSEAIRWYQMAADGGDATAQYNLGAIYRSGKGVEQNYTQAKRWFRESADQGYAAAQNELANLERLTATNIATRTAQAKPELFPTKETMPSDKQAVPETTKPIQKEGIAIQAKVQITTSPTSIKQSKSTDNADDKQAIVKIPLFSVEKKDLLTLDKSQLDIAKSDLTPDVKPEKEVILKFEEPTEVTQSKVEETKPEVAVNKPAPSPSSAIHDTADIPTTRTETNPLPQEFSDSFFSESDTEETVTAVIETEPVTEEILIAKAKEPAPVVEKMEASAINQFRSLADAGDSEAQAHLGSLYYTGEGVKQDFNEAYKWYRKSAEQNNMEAQYNLGNMYLLGEAVTQDNAEAEKWYALAGDQGHISAKNNLKKLKVLNRQNELQQQALATQGIQEQVKELITPESEIQTDTIESSLVDTQKTENDVKSYAAGKAPSDDALQLFYSDETAIQESEPIIKLKVDSKEKLESDPIEETQELAMLEPEAGKVSGKVDTTIVETETIEDINKIKNNIDSLRLLATTGGQDAQYKLGAHYYSGDEVKQDYALAALWYRRAAQQGNVNAQYRLGNMYFMGEGINQDDQQAAYWYALAADQDHESARHNLTNLQKTRAMQPQLQIEITARTEKKLVGVEDNTGIASKIIDSDPTGKITYEKGLAYAYGDGVRKNDRLAFNLFYAAAKKGYAPAQYRVAVDFAFGEAVHQDNNKAVKWYRKAAEQGYTIAQRNLATFYLDGKGVQQDKVQALAWYQVVASNGNAMDIHRRNRLQKKLTETEIAQSQELAKQILRRLTDNPSL